MSFQDLLALLKSASFQPFACVLGLLVAALSTLFLYVRLRGLSGIHSKEPPADQTEEAADDGDGALDAPGGDPPEPCGDTLYC
ncbi:hypothetical protein GN956_G12921 [Arapaima gigas]